MKVKGCTSGSSSWRSNSRVFSRVSESMKSKSVGVVTPKFVVTEDIKPQESLQPIAQINSESSCKQKLQNDIDLILAIQEDVNIYMVIGISLGNLNKWTEVNKWTSGEWIRVNNLICHRSPSSIGFEQKYTTTLTHMNTHNLQKGTQTHIVPYRHYNYKNITVVKWTNEP